MSQQVENNNRGIQRKAASEKRERDVTVRVVKQTSSVRISNSSGNAEAAMRILLASTSSPRSSLRRSEPSLAPTPTSPTSTPSKSPTSQSPPVTIKDRTSKTESYSSRSSKSESNISGKSSQFGSLRSSTSSRMSTGPTARRISAKKAQSPEKAEPDAPPTPPAMESRKIDLLTEKLEIIEPVAYENYLTQKRSQLSNDPLRLMLLFPVDDVSASTIPRTLRTTCSTVPDCALREADANFVKECINSYTSEWRVINNKYAAYAGSYQDLPNYRMPDKLAVQHYEVDETDENKQDDSLLSPSGSICKQGFLHKTPFGSRGDIQFMRSYKRRFFYLKQLADRSFLLEYHKDDKSTEAKGNMYLDSLQEVIKTVKGRKYGMELRMDKNEVYNIAAESEAEMEEWYSALYKVIEQQKADSNSDKQSVSSIDDLDQEYADDLSPTGKPESFMQSLENSKHPELQKYARETERMNAQKRRENRQKLFQLYPRMQHGEKSTGEPECKPYEEEFGKRIVVEVSELLFRLSSALNTINEPTESVERGAKLFNPEPFFLTLALYDARNQRKVSEDFHVDINPPQIRHMLDRFNDTGDGPKSPRTIPDVSDLDKNWIKSPKKGIFTVRQAHSEIYLVARIEKVLQGSIANFAEPYTKPGDTVKTCQKVMKQAKVFCSRMGQYRMPLAWAARKVFKSDYGDLDMKGDFMPIYRQESSKLSNEDLLKYLHDIRRNPEKLAKLTELPGTIKVFMEPHARMLSNCLTPSLIPIMPWPSDLADQPTFEIEEFLPEDGKVAYPFSNYVNNLYIYPIQLKYDAQKTFAKARNIAMHIEFRDSDDEGAQPLRCFYGRPGGSLFTSSGSVSVLHHQQVPEFYEEVKLALPTQLNSKHHLLFRFYHVSCETGKGTVKKKETVDSFVGYSWIPLLDKAQKLNNGEITVPVAASMPNGYLSSKGGQGKTPEVKWVDGGKPLLKVDLKPVTTIYSTDPHLHNFFQQCEGWDGSQKSCLEIITCVKAMHAVEPKTFINFLPVIMNKLFGLLPVSLVDEVQLNIVRLIIFMVAQIQSVNREDVLRSYVKYVYETVRENEMSRTVHEELVKNLAASLRPSMDHMVIKNLMKHLWFFFAILIKSMAQHLILSNRLQAPRHQRFSTNFETGIRNLVQALLPHIRQKHKEFPQEAKDANYNLAFFIKNCFTYMDRGFVFRLINNYLQFFDPEDPKPLFEMKFELLRVVCSHEHYIALNLPLTKKGQQTKQFKVAGSAVQSVGGRAKANQKPAQKPKVPFRQGKDQYKDLKYDYSLTEEYCQNHFLAGLLLREVGVALHDVTEVRQHGIRVLRNLLAKHSADDRYHSKQHQARIATLYLPLISIILENVHRLAKDLPQTIGPATNLNGGQNENVFDLSTLSQVSTDSSQGHQGHERSNSVSSSSKSRSLQRDSNVLDIIAGRANVRASLPQSSHFVRNTGVRHSISAPSMPEAKERRMSASAEPSENTSKYSRALSNTSSVPRNRNRLSWSSSYAGGESTVDMQFLRGLQSIATPPTAPGAFSSSSSASNKASNRLSWNFPGNQIKADHTFWRSHSPTRPSDKPKSASQYNSMGYLAIPGGTPSISTPRPLTDKDRTGSSSSLTSNTSMSPGQIHVNGNATHTSLSDTSIDGHGPVSRSHSRSKSSAIIFDKLLDHEIKDLLVSFLYIIKNVNEEVLLGWWSQSSEGDQLKLFDVLELCLQHFRYVGKKTIMQSKLREKPTSSERSRTLPVNIKRLPQTRSLIEVGDLPLVAALTESDAGQRINQEANLAAECGMIILDVLGLYCINFRTAMDSGDGNNPLMRKVIDIFTSFLHTGQSESTLKNVFSSLRLFLNRFPVPLFKGTANLCGDLCLALLKNLNSKLVSTRNEACALLYLLMRSNFEFTTRKDFVRVHLQVIISVASLIGEANSSHFQESLATINNYANSDKGMQHTAFPSQVKDLTKKIRTVLMATAQMKEHEKDPEMLVDLQYKLAKSYASTPELRRTWLDSMARIHIENGNYSEAAHCYIHIAALIAEYLKRKGTYSQGVQAFRSISPNIEGEEKGIKSDSGMQDVQYTEDNLLAELELCAEGLQKAERYESMGEVYKLIIPFYEKKRDFQRLALAYGKLSKAYEKVMKLQGTGKLLLGNYFRVAFFGQHFEEDDGKEYIYKEPKVTTLQSICERLQALFSDKFGSENVQLIRDSNKVNIDTLKPAIAYIQVTFVKPFFDERELAERRTIFERSNNIRRFVFEMPYTKKGTARSGAVEDQFKRKTILTTSHTFPYITKRIQVVYQQSQEFNPLQVAVEELQVKVKEMNEVLDMENVDMKRLQLLLQGSVSVQVNAGPMAYAAAFLGRGREEKWNSQQISDLKKVFRDFVTSCHNSLYVNAQLIKSDQYEYHDDLEQKFQSMVHTISSLTGDKLTDDEQTLGRRSSSTIFSAISGTP
ncbi:dedicator of cytokinesis protein 9 isoform X3 [Strongylocentrotus purpuratus]|uniref:Dedicator of cytokinesis protein 9 n=1 Tax=Strongylocentrotus purpuratus TaxID=7668 RepID=A0A7M7SX88_STRPU|nr:dedicator of cytokinesis protein 9 isoform X3 [Strongylocentrotus purpuratus]